MKSISTLFAAIILVSLSQSDLAQSPFFFQYRAEYNSIINNTNSTGREERPRVGDRGMSTHPVFGSRTEAQVNGLIMINIPDTIKNLDHAELYLELWGGHPGTAGKRFQVNGGKTYLIPDKPTTEHHCEYLYPVIPFDFTDLVRGNNAIQFGCDRGTTFWGHYIIDQLAVRCYLKPDNPVLIKSGLNSFSARPVTGSKILTDVTAVSLDCPVSFRDQIAAVHYFAKYSGYDNNGSGTGSHWQGYTHACKFVNHAGTATAHPYTVNWNTRMIPDQSGSIALRALVEFKNGLFFWSDIAVGFTFPLNRQRVQIYYCNSMPAPFWSRANRLNTASFELPDDLSKVESAELHIRIWDGGEGNIREACKLNGIAYKITSGASVHDLVYTIHSIDPKNLRPGPNEIQLLSDTEHHGIEVSWPGPGIIIRYK